MPLTTTPVNACDVEIWLDNLAGTAMNISGSANTCNITLSQNIEVLRSFGSRWPARMQCGRDAEIALTIIYSETTDEGMDILKNWYFAAVPGNRTVTIYIPDKNVGADRFQFEAVLSELSWNMEAGEAGPIAVNATLAPNGEFTHSISAT